MPFSPESGEWANVKEYIEADPAAAAWFGQLHEQIKGLEQDLACWIDKYRGGWRSGSAIPWPMAVGQRDEMQAEIDRLKAALLAAESMLAAAKSTIGDLAANNVALTAETHRLQAALSRCVKGQGEPL